MTSLPVREVVSIEGSSVTLKATPFEIATMNRKAPLPSLRSQKPTWDRAAELARTWELNQLARRLEEIGLE